MSLKAKLLKNSKIEETTSLSQSKLWEKKDEIITSVPSLNLALSGRLDGGMGPGLLQIAGKSRRFKSKFALLIADAFLKKFSDGVVLLYDSEFGTPESYYNRMTVDNIIHSPVLTVEKLKQDMASQLKLVSEKENDKLLIIVDSLGNLASTKELIDAEEGNDVTDMTRAKAMKSLFRVVGATINLKGVYMIAVNHTYDPIGTTAKAEIVGGGTGAVYNANGIWIITAESEKDGKELTGHTFNIKIDKSRFVKQGSRIPVTVMFDGGIQRWSGMFDLGLSAGYINRINMQRYSLTTAPEGNSFFRKDVEDNDEFMQKMLQDDKFQSWVKNEFQYKD